jgi:hypothetical protein
VLRKAEDCQIGTVLALLLALAVVRLFAASIDFMRPSSRRIYAGILTAASSKPGSPALHGAGHAGLGVLRCRRHIV